VVGWVDQGAIFADVFYPPDSTALEAEDQDVDVSGASCPGHLSSEELSAAEVEAQIHKVLELGVISIPGAGPVPLR
jgi:hypothetical protein